jgi:hypothetical protein
VPLRGVTFEAEVRLSRSFSVLALLGSLAGCERWANGGWIGDQGSQGPLPCRCEPREIGADETVEEWRLSPRDVSLFWTGPIEVEYTLGGQTPGLLELGPAGETAILYEAVRSREHSQDPICNRVEEESLKHEDPDLACPDLVLLDVRFALQTEDGVFVQEALVEDYALFAFSDYVRAPKGTSSGSYEDSRFRMEASEQTDWPAKDLVLDDIVLEANHWPYRPLEGTVEIWAEHDVTGSSRLWDSARWFATP